MDKTYIKDCKFSCSSYCGKYKSATLSAVDLKNSKILTEHYRSTMGYELNEDDFIVKYFSWATEERVKDC